MVIVVAIVHDISLKPYYIQTVCICSFKEVITCNQEIQNNTVLGFQKPKVLCQAGRFKRCSCAEIIEQDWIKNQNLNYYIQTPKFVIQYMLNSVIPHEIHLNIENQISLSTIIYASYFYTKKKNNNYQFQKK